MSDMDTTAQDGRPCHLCGDDAVQIVTVAEGSALVDRALCGDCLDDQITCCPVCEATIYQRDGVRVYSTPELHCASCASQHPALIEGRYRELLNDTLKGL
jgi:hypothetical protein